ncbi:hypothetical protein [Nostoc sp. LPT]|uniref:hypothetical protein n=1 Tax=Nostoc sp. LPT TaxID=2815387 RepID=UPI001D3D0EAD|nr:hypothetical protein [Nostoc sp. LPT]MBN4002582.1 hypothetical protein [Nostoc sp. LPT]
MKPTANTYYLTIFELIKFVIFIFFLVFIIYLSRNVFAYIGKSFIIIIDLIVYPIKWIGIDQPAVGWFVLGLFIGGALGLIQALKYMKQYSYLSKIYYFIFASLLIIALTAYWNWESYIKEFEFFPKTLLKESLTFQSIWTLEDITRSNVKIKFEQYKNLAKRESNIPQKIIITEYFASLLRAKTGSDGTRKYFNSNRYEWYLNRLKTIQLGEKAITLDGFSGIIYEKYSLKDLELSAGTNKVDGSDDLPFGIIARYNNKNNFYYLLIKGNGKFAMGKYSKINSWQNLVEWHNSTAIHQGNERNILRIVCNGKKVIGWINYQRVGMLEDSSYNSGQAGFISMQDNKDGVAVFYDNLILRTKPE